MGKELEDLFLEMLKHNEQKLFRICSVYSKNSDDTKDLFQEVLINIWKSLPSFKEKSSIETWVYRITLNTCLRFRSNHIKKHKQFVSMKHTNLISIEIHDESSEQKERLIRLRHCISLLNKSDMAIITLYLEQLPYKEISNILGISENHVAVKVKRIKSKLFNCINDIL